MPDEVIFHAPTQHEMDPRHIEHAIIIAEERFVLPELGYDFYTTLANSKNRLVTADNKASLQALINASITTNTYQLKEGDVINAVEFMSSHHQQLWNWVLWKLTAEAVMFTAMPEGFVQFAAVGVVHATPPSTSLNASNNSTPELRSIKWAMDKKMQDRIDPLTESLRSYLCKNINNYPEYKIPCQTCGDTTDTTPRKVVWLTNIYGDED